MNIIFELLFGFIPKCFYASFQCFYQCPIMFLIMFILLVSRFKTRLLRLVCRLDEESICRSHDKMPHFEDSDEDKIDSEGELDGMICSKELLELNVSSEFSSSSSASDTSSSDY